FVASLVSGWTSRIQRQGSALVVAVMVWGGAIAIAGLTRHAWLVLAGFAVAGGADMISGVFRSTIAAAVTPDHLRGRVSGVAPSGPTGTSPASVMRCIDRWASGGTSVGTRWHVARLSQKATLSARQRNRQVNAGLARCS